MNLQPFSTAALCRRLSEELNFPLVVRPGQDYLLLFVSSCVPFPDSFANPLSILIPLALHFAAS